MKKWKPKIRALVDACASWLHRCAWHFVPDKYEMELEKNRKRICALETFLEQAQKERDQLRNRLDHQWAPIAPLLQKSDDELRSASAYSYFPSQDSKRWEVVTEYCCLGGCDMGIYQFDRERDALLFAALLTALGHKPSHNTACSDCYAEYMKGCV